MSKFLLLIAIVVGGGLVWWGRVERLDYGPAAPRAGAPAPNFIAQGLDHEPHTLSDYQGKVVILNFWATWCRPCRAEMPAMQALYEQYHDQGLELLALNANEDPATVEAFVEEYGLTFTILQDIGFEVSELYEVEAYPSTYFIDRRGRIQAVAFSGPMSESYIESEVLELLD